MVLDEPKLFDAIPEHQRDRVMAAAKAMCSHRDDEDIAMGIEPCGPRCEQNGTCVAFGLYGDSALKVIQTLDRLERNK